MREHRLIGYVKPKDQTRYSPRVAEANAAAQAQTHQQVLSDKNAAEASKQDAIGNPTGAAYYQQNAQNLQTQPQPIVDAQGNPTQAGILDQAKTSQSTEDSLRYTPSTGQTSSIVSFPKPPTKKQARQDQLTKIQGFDVVPIYDKTGNVRGTKNVPNDQKTAEMRQKQQELWAQEDQAAMQTQQKKADVASQAGGQTDIPDKSEKPTIPIKGPEFTVFDAQLSQVNAMITADPTLAATYTPQMVGLMQKRIQLENDFSTSLNDFNAQDKDNDGVSDGVQEAYGEGVEAAERRANESDRINKEHMEINLEAARIAKEMSEIAQKKFALDQHRTEQLQIENNIEMERKNRLIANKLGISTGGNGLRWMADEIRKGVETLTYLKEAGSIQEASFALETGRTYALNVRQATNGYDAQRLQIDTSFSSDIKNLNSIVTMDAKERKEEKKALYKDHFEVLDKLDTALADHVKEFNKAMQDSINAKAKDSKDNMMSTKDKLGFVQSLRSGINQNKTITQANDVDGFYGAVNAGYNRYAQILKDIASGEIDPKKGEAALGPSQSAVIGSLARILDPGSVVRNEEYERQTLGSSFVNRVQGYWEKIQAGGAGVTSTDIQEMKILADKLHESWESRLQQSMQPFILDVQDWNANYPDAQIDFAQVIPVNRIHLPEATTSTWLEQSGWGASTSTDTTKGFATTGGPAQGWRTDRHNNPLAFAMTKGQPNQFTKALDAAGIAWEEGDAFSEGSSMVTVKVLGDPVEASRVVLANTNALQGWYLTKTSYKDRLKSFGVSNNQDFQALPEEKQNQIIAAIYKHEVGNGSLMASISSPAVQYDDITFNPVGIDDDPVAQKIEVGTGTGGAGAVIGQSATPKAGPITVNSRFSYRINSTGGIITVGPDKKSTYDAKPDIYTPMS